MLNTSGSWVMVGHLNVPGLNPLPRPPTSMVKATYDMLRRDYHFGGIAITDDLGVMRAITDRYTIPQAVAASVAAGADMAIFTDATPDQAIVEAVIDELVWQASASPVMRARIAAAASKVLAAKGLHG